MQTQHEEPEVDKVKPKLTPKLQFMLNNFTKIAELEESFRHMLSEAEIKKKPYLVLRTCEGGWLPFRDVYKLQKLFDEEKTFFQALCLIKRIEICQIDSKTKQNSSENLVIKLNESFGNPQLNFYLKKQNANEAEVALRDLVTHSVFRDSILNFQISDASDVQQELASDKENLKKQNIGKISSDYSCVISGLKCFLEEFASDLVTNLSEDFFNIDAKPFKPKANKGENDPLDLGSLSLQKTTSHSSQAAVDPAQLQLEKKRQISQMYQYYNYLIFEKNKESFNDINPDLRKMTYKYDAEVKNAYMTVQASPEVIKAAMGMNIPNQNAASKDGQPAADAPPSPPKGIVLEKQKSAKDQNRAKTLRYTKEQILQTYRGMGQFKSPLTTADGKTRQYLELLLNDQPNVVLQSFKELPAAQADKSKIVSSVIDRDLEKFTKN